MAAWQVMIKMCLYTFVTNRKRQKEIITFLKIVSIFNISRMFSILIHVILYEK